MLDPGEHEPARQVPTLPQTPPFSALCVQPVAGTHASVVHGLPSSQLIAVPLQVPPAQTSGLVHAELSLHAAELLEVWQPSAMSQ